MIWRWWRARRRRNWLKSPFPTAWHDLLETRFRHWPLLTPNEQQLLRERLLFFVRERDWQGCGGLVLGDEHRVLLGAYAALMTLGWIEMPFGRLQTILVYPSTFVAQRQHFSGGQTVLVTPEARVGEAWSGGPLIVAWDDFLREITPGTGRNVMVHELAHVLDDHNGAMDGIPALDSREQLAEWMTQWAQELERTRRDTRWSRTSIIDPYGGTSPEELFAVATEAFFEAPKALQAERHEMYTLLKGYFRQDPAARWPKHGTLEQYFADVPP